MSESEGRRRRTPISCILCRSRKIRCNRGTPCSNCLKSRNGTCVYGNSPSHPPQQQLHLDQEPGASQYPTPSSNISRGSIAPSHPSSTLVTSSTNALTRANQPLSRDVDFLESRVRQLEEQEKANQRYSRPHVPTSDTNTETTTSRLEETFTLYKTRMLGRSHWMNGVTLSQHIFEGIEPHLREETSKVFSGIQRCKSLAKLIKSQRAPPWPSLPRVDLPSKDVADELVDCYLRATETIYRILHVTSFKRDYDALWVSGTEPDGAFLVQLKLVFAIGSITYDENFSLRTSAIRWVHEAQHYLSTPNFKSRLNIQSLQTHILLLLAREGLHIGGELIWISAGSLFRTSVFMGLHRDPDHLPKRTTFAAEMRRRLWNTILEITLQTSITSGTPPFISLLDFDTEPPRNFDDDQLIAEDARAKPEDHFTQSSLAIALRKTFPLRLAITKFLNDLGSSGTYREMLRLDTDLRVSYKALRQTLQAYNSNTLTPPSQFQLRAVDALINHYLSALHIPFLGPALNSTTHAFSRKVVLETALKIWCATYPSSISPTTSNSTVPPSSTPDDFSRFTSCGSGFFRTIAFQASVLIVFSLKTQLQEEETTGPVPLRPDLFAVLENAKTWTLQCIKSGQTNNKCYLLMCIVIAQMRGRVHERNEFEAADSQSVIMKAAEEAEETCLAILQEMAANGQTGADAAVDMQDPMSSNIPSEAMQDCDFMASYQEPFKHNLAYVLWQNADALFNFGGAEPMSWLFGNGSTEDSSLW